MPSTISIPVAEYVALNNKALMLEQIVRHAAEKDDYTLKDFVCFIAPFVHDATFAEAVAAENSNDNF